MYRISLPATGFCCLLLLSGCGTSENSSPLTPSASSLGGELFPYFGTSDFQFVGTYDSCQVYIRPDQTVKLRDEVLIADTFLITEEFAFLSFRPDSGKSSLVTDPSKAETLAESDFRFPPTNSLLEKALKVHAKQKPENGLTRRGQTRNWLYVGVGPDLHSVYISSADGVQRGDGVELIPILSVKEQRSQLYINPRTQQFAPVNTDQLGTPQDSIFYHPIRPGQMEDKIWEIIRKE